MNLRSWSTRRILLCVSKVIGANFVQEERAAVGDLEEAFLGAMALVNAPLTCPNRFRFHRSGGIDPAFTGTKERSRRAECR